MTNFSFSNPIARQGIMRGLVAGGHVLCNEMKRLILQGNKSGHVYRRGGVDHQASAPGEPPANDLGTLVQSISPPIPYPEALRVTIKVSADHARKLEYGTSKMAARPYARQAALNTQAAAKEAVLRELRAVNFGISGGVQTYSTRR